MFAGVKVIRYKPTAIIIHFTKINTQNEAEILMQ